MLRADWLQTDWSGGVDATAVAVDPDDQLGWTKFQSADSTVNLLTAGQVTIDYPTSWTQAALDGNLEDGTEFNMVGLTSNGELMLTGDATGTLGPQYSMNFNTTGATNQSTADPCMFFDEPSELYRLYYSYYDGSNWSIVCRTSSDGRTNWSVPILIDLLAGTDVRTPFMYRYTTTGQYRLYFSRWSDSNITVDADGDGSPSNDYDHWAIWTALSITDGLSGWAPMTDMALAVDPSDQAYCPVLYPETDGGFRLYYSKYFFGFWQICFVSTLNSNATTGWGQPYFTGVGRNFTFQSQGFSLFNLDNGTFRLYFDWSNNAYWKLGYTDSDDGMDGWTQPPVIVTNASSSTQPRKPFFFQYSNNTYRLFYTSYNTSQGSAGTGYYDLVYREQEAGPPFADEGDFTSVTFDFGVNAEYSTLFWNSVTPAGTAVKVQIATSNATTGPFDFVGPDGESDTYYTTSDSPVWEGHDGERYIRYKVYLTTDDTDVTPVVSLVKITTVRSLASSPFNVRNSFIRFTRMFWEKNVPEILWDGEYEYDFNDENDYTVSDPKYILIKDGTAQLEAVNELVSPQDDFEGDLLNTRKWVIQNYDGASVVQSDGTVLQDIVADDNGGDAQLIHTGVFSGDFDIQVDFNLVSLPGTAAGSAATISIIAPSSEPLLYGEVIMSRYRDNSNSIYRGGIFNGLVWDYSNFYSPDNSGILRITRNGGTATTYFWDSNLEQWTAQLSTSFPTTDVIVRLRLNTTQPDTPMSVRWDNFVVNTGTVDYRELTAIPQTVITQAINPENVTAWTSFTENAVIPINTTLRYQLSDDAGATWYWWDGIEWYVAENVNQFNDAATINTKISTFPITDDGIMVRMQLRSADRWNSPIIDSLVIGYTYTKESDVGLQLRTAPDNGGVPAEWSSWLGPTEPGDYYRSGEGQEEINPSHSDGMDDQWVQYRIFFFGETAFQMARVEEVLIRYGLYPSTPELISPINGAVDVSTSPPLTWEPSSGAQPITYTVEIDETPDFLTAFVNSSGNETIPFYPNLYTAATYYWRVRAVNAAGNSPWSDTWSFTTLSGGEIPGTPTLQGPVNGSSDVNLPIQFAWYQTIGTAPVVYRIQVADNPEFTNSQYDQSNLNALTYSVNTLSGSSSDKIVFYWHVMAINPYGQSSWSGTRTFSLEYNINEIFPEDTRQTKAQCFLSNISRKSGEIWGLLIAVLMAGLFLKLRIKNWE